VRPEVLLDEDHAGRAGLCGEPRRQREGRALSGGRAGGDEGDEREVQADGWRGLCGCGDGGEGEQ